MSRLAFLLLFRVYHSGGSSKIAPVTFDTNNLNVSPDYFDSNKPKKDSTVSPKPQKDSNVSFSSFDCDKLKLEAENLNADKTYSLKPSAVQVDNFGTAFYAIEESQAIKIKVTFTNNGETFTFCTNETPFTSYTSGIDFFVDDDTITSFGPVVETRGCVEQMTIQAGESKTTTLEFSGTIGFAKKKELDPNGWIESALMSVDLMIPDTGVVGDVQAGKEVCDLRAQTSIKLRQTFIPIATPENQNSASGNSNATPTPTSVPENTGTNESTAAPVNNDVNSSSDAAATAPIVTTINTTATEADDGWSLDNFKGTIEYNDKQIPRFSPTCMDYPELTGFTLSDGKPAPCAMICDQDIGLLCAQTCGLCPQIDEIYKFVNEKKTIDFISCNDTHIQTINDDVAVFYDELCPSILLGFKAEEANATAIFEKWLGTRMKKNILYNEVVQICSLNKFSFHCDPNSAHADNPMCSDSLTSGTVAYVFSSRTDPRVIYNCPFYFALPQKDRIATIFHEISHFTDITNTSDVPGGYTTSNQLEFAKTNTGITNAGNWDAMSVDSEWKKQDWPSVVMDHMSI